MNWDDVVEIVLRSAPEAARAGLRSTWAELDLACPAGMTWPGGGIWVADSEDLSDNMVEHWLAAMAPALAEQRVVLDVEVIHGGYRAPSYEVRMNDKTLHLYDLDEDGVPSTEDPWLGCTVEPTRVVNQLLATAGSDRRLVLMWPGGNECLAALVAPEALHDLEAHQGDLDLVVPD